MSNARYRHWKTQSFTLQKVGLVLVQGQNASDGGLGIHS